MTGFERPVHWWQRCQCCQCCQCWHWCRCQSCERWAITGTALEEHWNSQCDNRLMRHIMTWIARNGCSATAWQEIYHGIRRAIKLRNSSHIKYWILKNAIFFKRIVFANHLEMDWKASDVRIVCVLNRNFRFNFEVCFALQCLDRKINQLNEWIIVCCHDWSPLISGASDRPLSQRPNLSLAFKL